MTEDTMLEAGFSRTTHLARDLREGDLFGAHLTSAATRDYAHRVRRRAWMVTVHLDEWFPHRGRELALPLNWPVRIAGRLPIEEVRARKLARQARLLDDLMTRWAGLVDMKDEEASDV